VFETEFLTNLPQSQTAYRETMAKAVEILCQALPKHSYSGKDASALSELLATDIFPDASVPVQEVLRQSSAIISESVNTTEANTAAHLHCPPVIPALAAELILTALNQSMDSFDQAPAATILEDQILQWLCREVALGPQASGIFTSGGSQSNYMALLLARDACLLKHWNWSAQSRGLPPQASQLRIFCSEAAHFTAEKSAAQLGLGTSSVIRIATDDSFRMDLKALEAALTQGKQSDRVPMAIVATAGTTDFGSIDALHESANLASQFGAWFHIDAAYGSAMLFSPRHRDKLSGIEKADSISLDFHKLFWQPISCAAFLLRDAANFRFMKLNADYLNPELHEELGIPNLVTRSLATTRRFDALKLWVSLQTLGRRKFAEMVDATVEQAIHAAAFIRSHAQLELLHEPELGCVVFRYKPQRTEIEANSFNATLRQRLFETGAAVVGHTVVAGKQCLKLTCMNPVTSKTQIEDLLQLVLKFGKNLEDRQSPS